MILMSAQTMIHAQVSVRKRLLEPVLTAIFPWTLHHHHSIRSAHPLQSYFNKSSGIVLRGCMHALAALHAMVHVCSRLVLLHMWVLMQGLNRNASQVCL